MGKAEIHPDVHAWNKWLSSDEGKMCCEGNASAQYLENRLWRAFHAGRNAQRVSDAPKSGEEK